MNSKNIKRHLNGKLRDWLKSVDDEKIRTIISENTIITGGAMVSLLTGEAVNDYDVYFRTKDACLAVTEYYVARWNKDHPDKPVQVRFTEATGRIDCFISSKGIADENEAQESHVWYNFDSEDTGAETGDAKQADAETEDQKGKYRPRFITSNAITLTDKIQLVCRFYGEVEEIHKNYDFAHCTCAWSSWNNEVFLPRKALECIINKELHYVGSKYPLCSIIRTRKFIARGYHINAGQYVKMCMQLNALDLTDVRVLEDQLTGVDTTYFQMMIDELRVHMDATGADKVDSQYAMELINKLF